MTQKPEDPRVAIVRRWLGEDNPYERADKLLAELDAVRCAQSLDADPTDDELGRVAVALFRFDGHGEWPPLSFVTLEKYLDRARVAIAAWRRK